MCPNFPKVTAEADPAAIWGYTARTLTAFTGQPRTDLMGEDLDFEAGSGARKSYLDVAISSRSSHAAAAIWAVGTRELSGLTGTPRTDLIGENASFEAATGRPAKIPRLDSMPALETPVEQSIAMDGTEKVLVEKTDNKFGFLDGYVDLTPMQAGDTIVVRESMQIKSGGSYVKYAEETYNDVQSIPLLHVTTKPARYQIKVTAQQTAGTNRTLDVEFYRRVVA